MAANWTLDQVLIQLKSGQYWSGSAITYAFPSTSGGMYGQTELTGFQAVSTAQRAVFTLALQNWDDLILQNFQLTTSNASDIEFAYSSTGVDYAHAYYPTTGSAWFLKGSDVSYATPGSYGFTTIMHELGHALGLNHMGNYNGSGTWTPSSFQDSRVLSIMSYFGPSGGIPNAGVMSADWTALNNEDYSPQTPMVNDVYAIQQIYGASIHTRAGDTVYGFSSNVTGASANIYNFTANLNPILTIYDSSGTDTLNLSGWNTPSTINLTAGSYSSCNNMTNNIAIAIDCTIENAIGGGGNDTLTGNNANNRLDGGLGSDTVVFSGTFASYTISYDAAGGIFTVQGADGNDQVTGVENFQFSDILKSASEMQSPTSDTTAPTLVSTSPTDNATSVLADANLTLTFSETVQAGSGNLVIYNANGTIARTIAVTDATQVTISGSTVTINPTADLALNGSFYVNMTAGVLKDAANNSYAGISGTTEFNFSTTTGLDTTAPTLLSTSPADNATGILAGADLTLTFSEAMQAGSGDIVIYNADGTAARTIAVTDTTQVTISGSSVTINPTADLAFGGSYYVNMAAGVLKDTGGNSYAGISGATAFNFAVGVDDYPLDPATNGVVAVDGAAVAGTIETADDGDAFKVSLAVGESYIFNLVATDGQLDPFLQMYSPPDVDGELTLIASDDDSGGSLNSRIVYTAVADGTYYLVAWDYSTGTGAYTVSAEKGHLMLPVGHGNGHGNDVYDVSDVKDVVVEYFAEGIDTVRSSITYTLPGNVEKLVLTGFDHLDGTGNELNNTLTGNPGSNILDGGTGKDTMKGVGGDDFYFVDDIKDKVVEAGNEGNDEVYSSVSYKLGKNLESLFLFGNPEDNLSGTGNELPNWLFGDDGNNILNGGKGVDSFDGGAGDDTFMLDDLNETVTELLDGGTDTVMLAVKIAGNYTLGDNVEQLFLTGNGAINITGNASDNVLVGNAKANMISGLDGADTLDGGKGADILTGGSGADVFVFDTAIKGNVDTVADFVSGTDRLQLDHAIFTSLTVGNLNDWNNIQYDESTGGLYYDRDGDGPKPMVQFATLGVNSHPSLTTSDIVIV